MGGSGDVAPRRPRLQLAGALVALSFLGLVGLAIARSGLPPGAGVSGGDTAGTTLHLAIGAFVFALGIAGLILRPNAVVAVAALELMLVAAAFSLVAGDRRYEQPDGALAALVVVAVGIAQLAIAIGLLRPLLRSHGATDLDDLAGRRG